MQMSSCAELISLLIDQCLRRPPLFEPGEAEFWNDEHISKSMLAAHLDPTTDAASRRPETIDRSVSWAADMLALKAGDRVLDLGCGPGLYASRLAQMDLQITGLDCSRRSIEHAAGYAKEHGLNVDYRVQDYLSLADEDCYDAALLIYGDFCVLAPEQRSLLLRNVHRALRPDGRFVLDVTTRVHRARCGVRNRWYAADGGFWRPGPHLVMEQGYDYPDESIWLDQYVVVDGDGNVSVYRNWYQDYTPDTIGRELEQGQFAVQSLWGDLEGGEYTAESEWIGLVARKREVVE